MIKLAKLDNKPEIFYSIQGEGKNIGKPSVFIRLSLCNLYCKWCDTDYTWNWEGTKFSHINDLKTGYKKYKKEDQLVSLTDDEILNFIKDMNTNNVVITGGEPFVQQKDLVSLLTLLRKNKPNIRIEFETNGTLIPSNAIDALTDQYNVSFKLLNSGVAIEDRLIPSAMKFFVNSPKSNFKFVVDTSTDIEEVLSIIKTYHIKKELVYLMPQGTSVNSLKEKQTWLAEICKKYSFNYTDRLHIHIWGDKRGV